MNQYLDSRETALTEIILAAGATALSHFKARPAGLFTLKGSQDFLTEADTLVEQQIALAINSQFADDQILGEETGSNVGDPQALWVIDPIDGTANFARGIEHFCISIAFVYAGVTELGAIYNPASGELYQARRSAGATKNTLPLQVASNADLHSATFELGWSTRVSQLRYLELQAALLDLGANVRRGASGALALAWVAEGRIDGYIELHMNAWDCLAGLLLVREAGGHTGCFPQSIQTIFEGGPILATSPDFAETLSKVSRIKLADASAAVTPQKTPPKHHYPHPPISLIESQLPGWGMDIYIGGAAGASDLKLLEHHQIKTVINCAVNLDIDWVSHPQDLDAPQLLTHGASPIRYYKVGLIDGAGNPLNMLHGGYQLMRSALLQQFPDKPSYRNQQRGNVLVHCRGGRSRSVILVALFLHLECPKRYPTLQSAIDHIRIKRELHPDEWFETPKPEMIKLAEYAIEAEQILAQHSQIAISHS